MKIALIFAATNAVLQVWSLSDDEDELAIRYTLPDGNQLSPVTLGWAKNGYSIVPVAEFVTPPGKIRIGAPSYSIVNDGVVETYTVEDVPPPMRVTARQFKLQLLASGLIDSVEAWVSTQDRAVQIAFEASGTFVRDEPMMQAGFAALGFTSEQIDAFFTAAGGL